MENQSNNSNNILLIIVGLIIVAGISLVVGFSFGKGNSESNINEPQKENSTQKEETKLDENKVIELTTQEKIELNKSLNNKIPTLHMNLIGEHEVNRNVLSTEKEKYYFVYWYLIHVKYNEEKNTSNFKDVYDDRVKEDRVTIKLSYIHETYKQIFNSDFDDSLIIETITSDKYVYTPMAWGGGYPGTLKVNKLILNEKIGEYSLYVGILCPDDLTVEILSNPFNDEYIEYDSSLIKSSAIIKYKELNGRKVLISWVFTN